MLARHDVPAEPLVVEMTERSLLDDEATHRRLQGLHDLGVQIAIDDFGTGYSSLSYLRRLPSTSSRSTAASSPRSDEPTAAATVVATISELADVLGMKTIAEGIETEEQRRLCAVGCGSARATCSPGPSRRPSSSTACAGSGRPRPNPPDRRRCGRVAQ